MCFLLCGFGSANLDMKQHMAIRTKPATAPVLNSRPMIVLFLSFIERIGICSNWQVHCTWQRPLFPFKLVFRKVSSWLPKGISPHSWLEHSHQLSHKKCHFNIPKTYFITLAHHFTIHHLSHLLFFNSIH